MEVILTPLYLWTIPKCRWQPTEVNVCPGLTLNMSRWQLAELEKALAASSCLYVWIDRVAVPQHAGDLQRTLLAR